MAEAETFLERVAELVESGVPVPKALAASRAFLPPGRWRGLAASACADVLAGRKVGDALAMAGREIGFRVLAVVRRGEEQGRVAEGLVAASRLAAIERRFRLARLRLASAAFAAVAFASAVAGHSLIAAPGYRALVEDLGAELPLATVLALQLTTAWPLAAALGVAVLAGCARRRRLASWALAAAAAASGLRASARADSALALAAPGLVTWADPLAHGIDGSGIVQRSPEAVRLVDEAARSWALSIAARIDSWATRVLVVCVGLWVASAFAVVYSLWLSFACLCDGGHGL